MTDSKPVPQLDLAPKLKRPLSLWNPLDYLLLFYWVFYFPQALHWYEKKWGDGKTLREYTTFKDKIQFLREYPQQLTLWIQGIILTIIAPLLIAKFLELIVNINWFGLS